MWRGEEPSVLRKQEKVERKTKIVSALTFKQCAISYIEARRVEWQSDKHRSAWTRSLATHVYPIIGSLRPVNITTDLVMRVLEPVWLAKNETAKRLRGWIERVLDWAKVRGLRGGENPARWDGHLDQWLAAPSKIRKTNHHAALPYSEIGLFMIVLRATPGTAARALEHTILTAVRSNEAICAHSEEVDREGAIWEIPAERMKAKRSHRPLSSSALALLDSLPKMEEGPIFEGSKAGGCQKFRVQAGGQDSVQIDTVR